MIDCMEDKISISKVLGVQQMIISAGGMGGKI